MDKARGNLAVSGGLHVMTFTTSMRTLNGMTSEQRETTAPLPVLGLQGAYKLGGKWNLNGSVELFDVTVGDMQGTFSDFIVAVEHQTLEHFAFGFALNRLALRFDAGDEEFTVGSTSNSMPGSSTSKVISAAPTADRSRDSRDQRVILTSRD